MARRFVSTGPSDADRLGVKVRQSYRRVGKFALIMQQRYAHARQFGTGEASLRKLKTYLGRVIRDAERKIASPGFAPLAAPDNDGSALFAKSDPDRA
jgi:hypothetical protein